MARPWSSEGSGWGWVLALVGVSAVALVAACNGDTSLPTNPVAGGPMPGSSPTFNVRAGSQQVPFYWYRDEQMFLDVVPGQFVVRSALPDAATSAREALVSLGLDARSGRDLGTGHEILEVPGADRAMAALVAKSLRKHRDFTFASPVYQTVAEAGPFLPLDNFMVKFRDGVTPAEVDALNAEFGVMVEREPVLANGWKYYVLRYPESGERDILEIAAAYDRNPLTEWADPNHLGKLEFLGIPPTDPHFSEQWYLDNNTFFGAGGVPADINMQQAWDLTLGDPSITVVIIDSGVDVHEDIDVQDGGNFFPDGNSATSPDDLDPHGTSVAGILAANHNTIGVAGVAPNVTLISMRIGNNAIPDFATNQEIADVITQAYSNLNADVINNSWGFEGSSNAIASAVQWATIDGRGRKGTAMVFAAGNEGLDPGNPPPNNVLFPASLPEAIAVSGLQRDGNFWGGSSQGTEIDIAAFSGSVVFSTSIPPCNGEIFSLDIMSSGGCSPVPDGINPNYTSSFAGTSAAAPQVTGAIALALSRNSSLTLAEIRQLLIDFADTGSPWDNPVLVGAGKLNAGRVVANAYVGGGPGDPPPCGPFTLEC